MPNTPPTPPSDEGDSPQLPLSALERRSEKVRSWTDDVVTKGTVLSPHSKNNNIISNMSGPSGGSSTPPELELTARGAGGHPAGLATDIQPLHSTFPPASLSLHASLPSGRFPTGDARECQRSGGDEEMLPLGPPLSMTCAPPLPPPISPSAATSAGLLPPLHRRSSSGIAGAGLGNSSVVSRDSGGSGAPHTAQPPKTSSLAGSGSSTPVKSHHAGPPSHGPVLPVGPSVRDIISQTLAEQGGRADAVAGHTAAIRIPKEGHVADAGLPGTGVLLTPPTGDLGQIFSSKPARPPAPSASTSASLTSITRLYRPTPLAPATVASQSERGGGAGFESDADSVGSYEAVSLAADLGRRPAARLTRQHLRTLSTDERGAGGEAIDGCAVASAVASSRAGNGAASGASSNVPGIELCFDNLTIEAKQGYFFGTRKDMGGSRADYSSAYSFSKGGGGQQGGDFTIPSVDTASGAPSERTSRWAFLWRSFQRGVAVQNVSGLFQTRGLHVIFCQDRFVGGTMLKALAGLQRRRVRVTSGVALGNGLPVITSVFRDRRSVVSTSEVCVKDATVMENLTFAVNMRVKTAYADLLALRAAEWTSLSSYLDVRVHHLRPCQVYMLAVAMELVLDPSVLFLSHPLDDMGIADQGEVIAMLRRLARRKSVVISLDTMPFALSEGVSQVLLLSREGRMVFSGSPSGLQSFLSRLKREDVATDPPAQRGTTTGPSPSESTGSGDALSVQYGFYGGICNAVDLMRLWEAENLIPQVVAAFTQTAEYKRLKASIAAHKQKATLSGADGGFHRVPRTVPPPPSWIRRNGLLLHYMVRTMLVRTDFLFSWLFLVLSFVVCISIGDSQASDQGGMQNLRGIIFFLLNCVVHVNVMFVESESLERESFSHLRNNNYFNVLEFYGATMVRLLVPRIIFSLLTALFAKMIFVAASPLAVLAGLTSFTHSLLVLLMVYLWPRPQDVVFMQLLYYAYSVVFCGFLINITSVPRVFSAVSLLRPGYGGAISHVLRNRPYSCENVFDYSRNVTVVAYCYTGDQYLALQGFSRDGLGINSAQLCITASVLMALVLITMVVF